MTETWKAVEGWPYEVSTMGNVRSLGGRKGTVAGRVLKPQASRGRGGGIYQSVTLRDYPRNWMVKVHTLVLLTFVGPRPSEKHTANHLNGQPADNRLANLEWVTQSENIRHAYATGLNSPSYGNAKLSEFDRKAILERHSVGETKRTLAADYGVSVSAIQLLVQGKTWRRSGPIRARNPERRASEFARCYHSKARVAFVQALGCFVCTRVPAENAHVTTGGMGRKSDYTAIVPLCRTHHRELHQHGPATFQRLHPCTLSLQAAVTERRWLAAQAAA